MADLIIRRTGRAGRITLNRPDALNALTHDMARGIHAALEDWRRDPQVALVVIGAAGDRAFCAGGDIAALYRAARNGDHQTGRAFFRDEYRMNAAIDAYPKPIVAFMQGFVMGGGVGIGGHSSHRIVGDSTRVSMPEAGIGLIPDVGGTWLLGRAPGRVGEYLGLTGARMAAGDAIHAGLADHHLPEAEWPELLARLEETGDVAVIPDTPSPPAPLGSRDLDAFGANTVADIETALERRHDHETLAILRRQSPLSKAATLAMIRAARRDDDLRQALAREYRFTHRATTESDFLEGVRAQVIDKDRRPHWAADASAAHVQAMLAPLGRDELEWRERT